MIFKKLLKFQIDFNPVKNPLALAGKLVSAISAAYWPLLIFELIIFLVDFIVFKGMSQKLIVSAMFGFICAIIFHELGHILTAKFIGKLSFNDFQLSARLFRVTVAHPYVAQKNWLMIIMAGPAANFLIGIIGWFILPNIFYREVWLIIQIIFGIINLIPPSPDGEKLFAYYLKS